VNKLPKSVLGPPDNVASIPAGAAAGHVTVGRAR
jgi:hypothetical protein